MRKSQSSKSSAIFGIGTVVMDHVAVLPCMPARDAKCEVVSHWRQIGGPVPVALSTAAFYGSPTHFCGRWGKDSAGFEIETGLAARNIGLVASRSRPDWTTGFAHVWTEPSDGARTIAYSRGEFPALTVADLRDSPDVFRLLDACQILHLDGTARDAGVFAAEVIHKNAGRVVLDAGSKKPGMEELFPYVDVLVASDLFCTSWFGDPDVSMEQLRALGPGLVIRTKGAAGATFDDGGGEVHVPAAPVEAMDTNGAGDIFSGAVLHGLSSGWEPRPTVVFANAVAGYACSQRGNSTWLPLDD